MTRPFRLVILISGSGSNLQAFIDAVDNSELDAQISAVFSNRPDAYGLQRAEQADIPNFCLDHTNYPDRSSYDADLAKQIERHNPDLVILAGYMRILTADFVQRFSGHLINIHPSLLPKYPGLHTHQKAIDAEDKIHGTTVHFVTEDLDGGPPILQATTPISADDDAISLASKVQALEHQIYPLVAQWFAEKRLKMKDGDAYLDDELLAQQGLQWPAINHNHA